MVIGITFSGVAQRDLIRRSMEIEYDGRFLFETVQATWNLLETSAEDALAEAAYEGIVNADLPVIQGTVLFGALFIVVANFIVDIAYAFLDPRVRYS